MICNKLCEAALGPLFLFLLEERSSVGYYSRNSRQECRMLTYKVIELSTVTEETIQEVLNEWSAKGWRYDGMQFAMRDSSRRPAMAFLLFIRDQADGGELP